MSLNEVISTIGTLVGITVPVVGVLLFLLTKKPDKKVVFIVSIGTVFVIAGILFIAITISDITGGNTSSAAQQTGTGITQTTGTTNTTTQVTQTVPTPPTVQINPLNPGDADSVMKNFCDYVNSGYIQGAYGLTSSTYQAQQSITNFTNQFSDADLGKGGCLYNPPQVSGNTATVSLTFYQLNMNNGTTSTNTYTVTLAKDPQNNNELRIQSIQ